MEFVKGPAELFDDHDKLQGLTFKNFLQLKPVETNEGIIDCLYFIRQIADALAYCHSQHVYHLDIKPSNFLVSDQPFSVTVEGLEAYQQYRLKLIDFGSAKVIENDEGVTSTLTGSQGYTAPEVDGGDFLSNASKDPSLLTGPDIYALGASLLYCFTERVPFGRRAIEEKLSKAKVQVPEEVQNIILKAMEYDPQERYRTAEEMQEALEEAIKVLAEPKTVIIKSPRQSQTPKSPSTPSKKEGPQKKSPVKWIVAVILIVAVAVAVLKIPKSPPTVPPPSAIDRGPITALLSEGNYAQVEAEISMMMNNDLSSEDQTWLEDRQTYVRLMQEASDLSDQSRCDEAIAKYEEAREKCLPDHEDQIDDKIKLVNMTRGLNGCN